jgi:hypothetical protein
MVLPDLPGLFGNPAAFCSPFRPAQKIARPALNPKAGTHI